MNKIKHLLLAGITLITLLSGSLLAPATVAADASTDAARQQACIGAGGTFDAAKGVCTSPGPDLTKTVKAVVNILSILVGIVSVIMIMVAGFKYITSGGDSGSITSAKNTLVYAIIGLVIVALAQSIVRFVLEKLK